MIMFIQYFINPNLVRVQNWKVYELSMHCGIIVLNYKYRLTANRTGEEPREKGAHLRVNGKTHRLTIPTN